MVHSYSIFDVNDTDLDERQTRGTYVNISSSETACFAETAGEYWFMSNAEIQANIGSCLQDNFGSLYYHRYRASGAAFLKNEKPKLT